MSKKPPTQGVGVQGFKADVYAADEVKIDWHALLPIPKFQAYCVELSKLSHGEVDYWLGDFVAKKVNEGEMAFFDAYCKWHDEKGYWKQEDYYGVLINGD
ncbi:hypothetical protein [Acinetobacter colistiniresistens]|uniref:hypothetical protein n=1 Tax=Acinetobacter colistiniresistens TaxID=280145 RepID=UPI002FE12BA7